ncbi:hypothetical protein, partial [Proteus mirabilis]|uniref:hypothetical protein n=1 Tax=Proteus mirabilis TaxID=584 RepID=UPI00195431FB
RLSAGAIADCEIEVRTEFLDDLSPQHIASRMLVLGQECDALGVVAAVHPLVVQAVDTLQARNVPVFALISQISATGEIHYVDSGYNIVSMPHPEALKTLDAAEQAAEDASSRSRG